MKDHPNLDYVARLGFAAGRDLAGLDPDSFYTRISRLAKEHGLQEYFDAEDVFTDQAFTARAKASA